MRDDSHATLAFAGTINASLSHELKNVLAIVSETSGLMEDLLALGARDPAKAPAPERIAELCARNVRQAARGNDLLRTLNRFAHSADEPVADLDLADAADLAVRVNARFAELAKRSLELGETASITLRTALLNLQHLLHRCVLAAIAQGAEGDALTLSVQTDSAADENRARLLLTPFASADAAMELERETRPLCDSLGGSLTHDAAASALVLTLPALADS